MSLKDDENQSSPSIDLTLILAIAGRLDAQCHIIAHHLDKDSYIHYAYAVCDSLSSGGSMYRWFVDVFVSGSNGDTVHDLMLTPGGLVAAILETLFLVGFSVFAVRFDKGDPEDNITRIARAWPYVRNVIKGLKNAYKGWRSAVTVLSLLDIANINYLVAPVGLALGAFSAANRCWHHGVVLEKRKAMMTAGDELRKELERLVTMTDEEGQFYFNRIKPQDDSIRFLSFVSVSLGGFLDGLYLYVGVLGLAVLSPQMLAVVAAISVFYTLACVVVRIYEEYDYQIRLVVLQEKCKLKITAKLIEMNHAKLLAMQGLDDKSLEVLYDIKIQKARLINLLEQFESYRSFLSGQSKHSYLSAALLGLKNGLYAYGALTSALFLVALILALCGVAFPPALLLASSILGLVFISCCMFFSLKANYNHLQAQEKNAESSHPYDHLIDLRKAMELDLDSDTDSSLDSEAFNESLKDGLSITSSPQSFVQEWCEVFRSLCSGFSKGQRFVDFAGSSLQELDDHGHYADTPIMYVLSLVSAVVFGCILALRAFARGLGRTPLGQDPPKEKAAEQQQGLGENVTITDKLNEPHPSEKENVLPIIDTKPEITETGAVEPSILLEDKPAQTRVDSHKFSDSTLLTFFARKNRGRMLTHSGSETDLSAVAISDRTTLDLKPGHCTS